MGNPSGGARRRGGHRRDECRCEIDLVVVAPRDENAQAEQLSYVATEQVVTRRLDSLATVNGSPTWLKVDVQGFEIEVFGGAERTLGEVAAVECEMVLEPLYIEQGTAREIVDLLDDRGLHRATVDNGQILESARAVWIDAIFRTRLAAVTQGLGGTISG